MGFWKKLGKIAAFAAPIAAAPFTGGTSLALIGAGAGAAGGALSGGGLKSTLLGAGLGAIPGLTKATAAAKGASSMGGGSVVSKLLDSGKQALLGKAGESGGGLLKSLLSGDTLNAAGQGVGAIGQTQAHNRGVALDAMMMADQNQILADRDRRESETDLMKKIQIANYIKSGGFQDPGQMNSANGKPFTKFDFGTRPSSEAEMKMANTLEGQLMDRLNNPRKLRDYDSKMEPGKMESMMNLLSPALTTLGVARGAGKYQSPMAQAGAKPPQVAGLLPGTQLPLPQVPPAMAGGETPVVLPEFTPGAVNPAGNPWSSVKFTDQKLFGNN